MGWTWEQICADPTFASLTNLVESDEWGNAVVLPISDADHSARLSAILHLLNRLMKGGDALVIVPVHTAKGVKAVDAAWLSKERRAKHALVADALVMAPEICVEVAAPYNQSGEIAERIRLYLAHGATEGWVCAVNGKMTFYDADGLIRGSALCPDFPEEIEIDLRLEDNRQP